MKLAEPLGIKGWSAIAATWVAIAGGGYGFYTSIVEGREAREAAEKQQVETEQQQVERWEAEDKAAEKEISGTKAQTLKMFEIFNSSELLRSRDKVYGYLDRSDAAQARLKLNDVLNYFDFFDALQLCIEEGLCDKPTAVKLFQGYAIDAWFGLEPEIVELREEDITLGRFFFDPEFGFGVQWLQSLAGPDFEPDGTQPDAPAQPVPALVSDAVPKQPEQ